MTTTTAKQTVLQNKVSLIRILSADHLFILQHAQQNKIITEREYDILNHKNHTSEEIVIKLLDKVMNKDEETCRKFLDLFKHEDVQETFPRLRQLFNPASTSQNQENPVRATDEEDECYPMIQRPVGHCLIINNYDFKDAPDYDNRRGTDADKDALTEVFEKMHFSVDERRDCSSSDMLEIMKEFSMKDHSKMDAFACCILSHGEKGTVVGIDGISVPIHKLIQPFAPCSMLMGKPKLFFIQACQGTGLQEGVWRHDGTEEDEYEDDARRTQLSSIPVKADFVIGMATVEFYKSFRHRQNGSIYIQELCKQLKLGCPRRQDILTILTKVNRSVSEKVLNCRKQMPEPRYTLTKKLVLPMD